MSVKLIKDGVYDSIMQATLVLYTRWKANPDLRVTKRSIQYRAKDILTRQKRREYGYLQDGGVPKKGERARIINMYNDNGDNLVEHMGIGMNGEILISSDGGNDR